MDIKYHVYLLFSAKNNAIYQDKTQHANFRGNPLYKATKPHLNNN